MQEMYCVKGNCYCTHASPILHVSSYVILKTRKLHTQVKTTGTYCNNIGADITYLIACPRSPDGRLNESIPELKRWYSEKKMQKKRSIPTMVSHPVIPV